MPEGYAFVASGLLLLLSQGCNIAIYHTEAGTEAAVELFTAAKKHTSHRMQVPIGLCHNCSKMKSNSNAASSRSVSAHVC